MHVLLLLLPPTPVIARRVDLWEQRSFGMSVGAGQKQHGAQSAMQCLLQVVETLIRHNADCNLPDVQGFTPLHIAAREGKVDLAKLLISHGSNVEAPDNMGKVPAKDRPRLCFGWVRHE